MARTDFRTPRLYVPAPLAEGGELMLPPQQTNYLVNVMRLGANNSVLLFNGRDGEFAATLAANSRKGALAAGSARERGRRRPRPTSIIYSLRSSTPASTIWRKRRSRWACDD